MRQRKALRTLIRVVVLFLLLVLVGYGGALWLEHALLQRSETILTELGGPGSTTTIGKVEVHLLAGDVQWTDVRISGKELEPDGPPIDGVTRLRGRIDTISVRGLSLWQLLVRNALSVRTIAIRAPDLDLFLSHDSAAVAESGKGTLHLTSIKADSLRVDRAAFHLRHGLDSATLWVDTLDLAATGFHSAWNGDGPYNVRFDDAGGSIVGLHGIAPHVYDLQIARIELLEEATLVRVTDAALKPLADPEKYAHLFRYETDYFDVQMDTLLVDGLEPLALINSLTLRARSLSMAGAKLDLHRDKTMPDDPNRYVHLPARMLRDMRVKMCVDTLELARWSIVYHEKGEKSPEFGDVTFNDLRGTVTGLCSEDPSLSDTLVVTADARAYDKANVHLTLRTVIADSADRFQARATISALPMHVFNSMATELMLAKVTGGNIGGVDITMNANNNNAHGRVDMEYDDLAFEFLKADGSGESRKFLSSLANLMIHKRNLRSDPDFRHGDFEVERDKQKSIFNYLWSALREGMVVSALPGVLDTARQIELPKKQ